MSDPIQEVAERCLGKQLRALARVVSGIFDAALRKHGLKASQLNVLVAIAAAQQTRPSQLVKTLHLDKSTLSRNVEKMERQGWIHIQETGRSQTLSLTAEGKKLLDGALADWRSAQAQAEVLLGPAGVKAVGKLTKRLDEAP